MGFHGIGIREVVALVVLAGALAIGAGFCDPGATGNTPEPRATATAVARTAAEGLSPWNVTFLEGASLANSIIVGSGEYPELDLAFDGAPFPDMKDDRWSLSASATFNGAGGVHHFELTWSGEVTLSLNSQDQAVSPATGSGRTLLLPFEQAETPTTFTIRLTDVSGPAAVSARVIKQR